MNGSINGLEVTEAPNNRIECRVSGRRLDEQATVLQAVGETGAVEEGVEGLYRPDVPDRTAEDVGIVEIEDPGSDLEGPAVLGAAPVKNLPQCFSFDSERSVRCRGVQRSP